MSKGRIENVIIVGGGTAGWITAAMLSKYLGQVTQITLIESDAIGTVGVGEATIPQIQRLNNLLGLNEAEVMKASGATFKLGIEFSNWGKIGERYMHAFGYSGMHLNALQFHNYWLRSQTDGSLSDFWDYSPNLQACNAAKFKHSPQGKNGLSGLIYAYHFDAGLYAQYLRKYSQTMGTRRIEGKIVDVEQHLETGDITGLKLESGDLVSGDLFVDCSGFRALITEGVFETPYHDWRKWLPCDRAVAVGCNRTEPLLPYTKAIAHQAGWQWRIPLQHRLGNGHVFASQFMEPAEAEDILLNNLDGGVIGTAKHLSFKTGRRDKFWVKNCVAIGLSSGFLEPLESTSIHLVQTHAGKLIEQFPSLPIQDVARDEYNRQCAEEFDLIRDFLILHYKQTERDDSEFWRYCKNMDIPDTLATKMELFRQTAKLRHDPEDLFAESSWVQVMLGQGLTPLSYHTRANALTAHQTQQFFERIKSMISADLSSTLDHAKYIERYCPMPISEIEYSP